MPSTKAQVSHAWPLLLLACVAVAVSVGSLLEVLGDEELSGVMIDVAGRQRMLNERYVAEVLLASAGRETEFERPRKLFDETLQVLRDGGVALVNEQTGETRSFPPAVTPEIERSLNQQQMLLEELLAAAQTVLGTGGARDVDIDRLIVQRDRLQTEINRSVKLLDAYSASRARSGLLAVGAAAVILMSLCVGLFLQIRRSHALNKKLTEESRQRQDTYEHLNAVVSGVVDGIITINERATVQSFNRAAEKIFGYDASEVIGQNVKMLMPEPFQSEHDQYVANYVRSGEAKVIGIGREVVGRRHDGSEFPMDLAISAARQGGGRQMFVGIVRDITQRKRHEAQLEQQAAEATLLHQVTTIVEDSASFEDALQRSIDVIREATGWPVAHVYLPSAGGDVLVPSDAWSVTDQQRFGRFIEVTAAATFARGVGLPGRIWESGRAEWICDVQKDPNFPRAKMCADLGVRGAFGFPVKIGDEVLAALEFFTEEEMQVDQHLLMIAESIGEQMGRVEERRRAQNGLREAKDAAEAANQAKSRFLANMSHELRTPLNSVIGFANILLRNKDGHLREKEASFLERIATNGQHLLGLINEILDLSKIEADSIEIEHQLVHLDMLIHETVQQLEGQVTSPRVKLLTEVPQPTLPIVTDPDRLKQVLINLIGNAIKFTESGHVIVRLGTDSSSGRPVRIEVEDTGIGIPEDRQEAIFDAFQQADDSTSRRYGGTGLGLSISMALVKRLGCDIELESVPGHGSTFRIVLPQTDNALLEAEPVAGDVALPEQGGEARAHGMSEELTVLAVDDDRDAHTVVSQQLQDTGCRVIHAASGDEGLRLARHHRPDVVLLDLMMPGMSGWETLRRLKGDPLLAETPVVITSMVGSENRDSLVGVAEILDKPVSRETLIEVLRQSVMGKPSVGA